MRSHPDRFRELDELRAKSDQDYAERRQQQAQQLLAASFQSQLAEIRRQNAKQRLEDEAEIERLSKRIALQAVTLATRDEVHAETITDLRRSMQKRLDALPTEIRTLVAPLLAPIAKSIVKPKTKVRTVTRDKNNRISKILEETIDG